MDEIKVIDNQLVVAEEVVETIKQMQALKKNIKAYEDQFKEACLKAMEEAGVKKFENDEIFITYVAEHEVEKVDIDWLAGNHAAAYLDSLKKSKVKASVRFGEKKKK